MITTRLPAQDQAVRPPVTVDTSAVTEAAAAITPDELSRVIGILDSTPPQARTLGCAGLDRVAETVARELARVGVMRRDDSSDSTLRFRYPLPGSRRLNYRTSSVSFVGKVTANDTEAVVANYSVQARFLTDSLLVGITSGTLTLVTGRQTPATVAAAAKSQGDYILYLPPAGTDSASRQAVVTALTRASDVLVLTDEDTATFRQRLEAAEARPPVVFDSYMADVVGYRHWVAVAPADALRPLLEPLHFDLASLRADTVPRMRLLSRSTMIARLDPDQTTTGPTGVDVVGMLPGVDSSVAPNGFLPIAAEAIVVSAPLESPDVAALVALAKAFSRPGARPRRSVVFLATSGAAQQNIGARAFSPGELTMIGITLQRLGASPGDAIAVRGLKDLVFKRPLQWLATAHPELGLTMRDGGTIVTETGDHVGLVARALPALVLDGGATVEGDTLPTPTAAGAFDPEIAARRIRLAYYLIHEVANAPAWPRWTSEARERRRHLFSAN